MGIALVQVFACVIPLGLGHYVPYLTLYLPKLTLDTDKFLKIIVLVKIVRRGVGAVGLINKTNYGTCGYLNCLTRAVWRLGQQTARQCERLQKTHSVCGSERRPNSPSGATKVLLLGDPLVNT